MSYKIAILTTANAINFGAVWQAYALKSAVEKNDVKVEVVNYLGRNMEVYGRKLYRKNNSIKNCIWNLFVFLCPKYKKGRKDLITLFDVFKKEYIQMSEHVIQSAEQIEKKVKADVFICGSDQIWNLNLIDDKVFFLTFLKKTNPPLLYSYAASIAENMNECQMKEIKSNTENFQEISIREIDTARKLQKVLQRDVKTHIDPVFLVDRKSWISLAQTDKCNIEEPYILFFFIGKSKYDNDLVRAIVNSVKEKSVGVCLHPFGNIKVDTSLNIVSPAKMLDLIQHAKLVVTDSFHTTALSIILHKNFYYVKRSTRNIRIKNLMEILNIKGRVINNQTCLEVIRGAVEIDFSAVDKKIGEQKKIAKAYLKEICANKEEALND